MTMLRRAVLVLSILGGAGCGGPKTAKPAQPEGGAPDAAAAGARVTATGAGKVTEGTFHSDALGVDKHYVLYLPGGYDTSQLRYPVIYMLNGLGGDETNWVEGGDLGQIADAMSLPAIVVMADGDDSFYANAVVAADYDACLKGRRTFGMASDMATYCVKTPRYEDYIVKDLVAHVDATYRTIPERRARAIGGLSMGGFGALSLGLRHKDVYVSTASHSGVDALLYGGPHPYEAGKVVLAEDASVWGREIEPLGKLVRDIFGPDLQNWREHDPAWLAGRLKDGEIAIYLDCGTEDDFKLHDGATYLHDILVERGVTHAFTLEPGRHNFKFWRSRLDDSLAFHVEQFRKGGL